MLGLLVACSGASSDNLFPDSGSGADAGGVDATADTHGGSSGGSSSGGHEGGHKDAAVLDSGPGNDGTTGDDGASGDGSTMDASGGCNVPSDCPQNQACDPISHTCSSNCGNGALCNGGCCNFGTCVQGGDNGACGNGGDTCTACSGGTPTCSSGMCGDACGGNGAGTCDQGYCCSQGHCIVGGADQTCGDNGDCQDCTMMNQTCMNGVCMNTNPGCMMATDCPPGQACNLQNHMCGTACGFILYTDCNGGCCSNFGQCQDGTADQACGASGSCTDCSLACNPGPRCVNQACGCMGSSDCANNATCGLRKTCNGNGQCQ